jgi:hypothetical protein
MGYNSLNGASASAISALYKYGLLDRLRDEIKVSDRAMRILHPHSPEERSKAIQEAAYEPPLFAELRDRFPGQMPSDDLLRNYLIRNGFAPGALTPVMLAYRETSEMAEREVQAHDSLREQPQEHVAVPAPAVTASDRPGRLPPVQPVPQLEPAPTPVIAMMEDHFIVNMVVRSRDKARALRRMIEMAEGMLPEEPVADTSGKPSVSHGATDADVAEQIDDNEREL